MIKSRFFWIFFCMSCVTNIVLFIVLFRRVYNPVQTSSLQSASVLSYRFLSPRVFINQPNDVLINFVSLRSQLEQIVANTPMGIYFEYLPSGVYVGVNEKVPMFATTQIPLLNELESLNSHQPIFDYLDFPQSRNDSDLVVSPKNFSSVLRNLYLSTYLDLENSNKILKSHVQHVSEVDVSMFRFKSQNSFGDCRLVYRPKRPYVLCMMAKSDDLFEKIFRLVYEYVDAY